MSLGHQRPGAVGADQVLGPDGVGRPGEPVPHRGGHAVVVLHVAQVLGREPGLGAARGRVLDQDRLQVGLRDVADQAGRGELVVGLAGRVGAPGLDPADLLAGDRRAEHGVADQFVRGRVREHLVLDPEVAEDLHRPLVGDVRARRVGRPPVLGDHDVRHPEGGQAERRRAAGGSRADDQHVGLDRRAGRDLGLGDSVIEGRHGRAPFRVSSCARLFRRRPPPPRATPPNGGNEKHPSRARRAHGMMIVVYIRMYTTVHIPISGRWPRGGGRWPGDRSAGGRRVRSRWLT